MLASFETLRAEPQLRCAWYEKIVVTIAEAEIDTSDARKHQSVS